MNSNTPRDPLLIPVVLTIPAPDQALPAGVTVSEIVFPAATDLDQRGTVLSVFEREFTIGVTLKVAAGTAAGKVSIPARLRYQACDESMLHPDTRETSWDFTVGAARSAAARMVTCSAASPLGTVERPRLPTRRDSCGCAGRNACSRERRQAQ